MLQQLYHKAFGNNQFGFRNNLQIWSDLHRFLEEMPSKHYVLLNDDLVGFFTSVPQEDILAAVNYCLDLGSDCDARAYVDIAGHTVHAGAGLAAHTTNYGVTTSGSTGPRACRAA